MKTKRTGFTLVELLVVIAIIALLMGILMPALAKVRHIAYRMVCGNNVGGIGKSMMVYANDNSESYPISGGKNAQWDDNGQIGGWTLTTEQLAFGAGNATITSCFYYLVRFSEMPPKQFICKGDVGAKEMKLNEFIGLPPGFTFQDGWDFGGIAYTPTTVEPGFFCSYSYQIPWKPRGGSANLAAYPVTAVSSPETPVVADRNPAFDKNAAGPGGNGGYFWGNDKKGTVPFWQTEDPIGPMDPDKTANSAAHQRDGQNVLFNDSHVSFELTPWCGIQKDEIYLAWIVAQAQNERDRSSIDYSGTTLAPGPSNYSRSEEDAFLVNEVNMTTWK